MIDISLILAAALSLQARTLYVSPSGDDAASGTSDCPIATFKEAARRAPDVDTIMFRGGTYILDEGVILEELDGKVLMASPGETPVFRGSVTIDGWKKVRDRKVLARVPQSARKNLVEADLKGVALGDPVKQGTRPELYCDGALQTLSRWPDSGFTKGGHALGETVIPPVENGNSGAREGIFEYLDSRIDRWSEEAEPCVAGYWFWDWDDDHRHATVSVENRSITLDKDRPCRHGNRFYGYNLLCELDTPGEWYIDRAAAKIYWLPSKGAETTLSMLQSRFMVEMRDCKGVTLHGLCFAETRGSGISIKGGADCEVIDCIVENTGVHGIIIDGGVRHRVDGCVVRHTGGMGIHAQGGDRKALQRCDIEVCNTLVEDFARFKRTYCEGIGTDGCGIHVHHNELRTSPSSAFALGGNDIVAEFNHIHNVCQESDDQGGFDLYLDPSMRGIVMRYNRWSDITGGTRYGVAAIRLDDLITGVTITGNVFERCGAVEFGAIQVHGGSENVIEDNLFYHCPEAVSFTTYGDSLWHVTHDSISKMLYEEIGIQRPEYLLRYPEIREFGRNIDVNIIRNNLLVGCDSLFFRDGGIQIESNNRLMEDDGRSVGELCKGETLHPLGIRTIPLGEMGIKRNRILGIE